MVNEDTYMGDIEHDHGAVDQEKVLKALENVNFPADKKKLLDQLEQGHARRLVSEIPNEEYDNAADVLSAINALHG